VTSSRCNDAVSSFRRPIDLAKCKHDTSPLSPRTTSNISDAIAQHNISSKRIIKETAKRISIWEQISPELLLERTQEEIVRVGIARSQTRQVIDEISNVIRVARDTRSNCFSEIVQILAKWRDVD
jgi:hypothetical protein